MTATNSHRDETHRALIYNDSGTFIDAVGAFARAGLGEGAHVLAVLAREKCGWLREELGPDADTIRFLDPEGLYERHGPMFRTLVGELEQHGTPGTGRVRVVAEQALAGRDAVDVRAYMRYEAAANVLYRRFDVSVLCPYDATRLPEDILRAAQRTHPEVIEGGGARRSELFMDPRTFVRMSGRDTPAPAAATPHRLEQPEDVASARALVCGQARAAGLTGEPLEDLAVAVSEVATNAIVHGHGPRLLWSYIEDDHLVCRVRDAGAGPADPLVGYLPPDEEALGGRGLWLAHQLCDVVEVASDAARTSVSLRVRLPAAR